MNRSNAAPRAVQMAVLAVMVAMATVVAPASASAATGGSPFGNGFDRLSGVDGGVAIKGWALDPDTADPVSVRVSIDGSSQTVTADRARPDVERAFGGYGDRRGYDETLSAAPGERTVCVTFVDVGVGSDRDMGCRTVTVPGAPAPEPEPEREGGSPFGNGFDRLSGVDGGVAIKGWALDPDTADPVSVRVSIDGSSQTVTADRARPDVERAFGGYGDRRGYDETLSAAPGERTVCVTFVDVGVGSDRDMGCRTVTVPGAVAAPSLPGPSTTGVPHGTALTVHRGDLRIDRDGTVIDGMDIRGYVEVKADNVVIRRSILRGGSKATTNRALVMSWWGAKNLRIEDSTLVAMNPSLHVDGVSGGGFTASRLDISGVVDAVKVIGSGVTVEDSWLHDTLHSTNDPNQRDGRTHDDSIQVEGGSDIILRGNVLEDAHNAGIQVTQNYSATKGLRIEHNVIRDGVCTLNVTQRGLGSPIQGMVVRNNRFGPGSEGTRCPMLLPGSSPIAVSGNVWHGSGERADPRWF